MNAHDQLHAHLLHIAQRIEAIDDAIGTLEALTHDTYRLADLDPDEQHAVHEARHVLELPPLTSPDDDPTEGFDPCDFDDALLGDPIEVKATGYHDGACWHVDGVVAVVCTGGPHIELTSHGAHLHLDGWHAGTRVTSTPVTSARASERLEAIAADAAPASR